MISPYELPKHEASFGHAIGPCHGATSLSRTPPVSSSGRIRAKNADEIHPGVAIPPTISSLPLTAIEYHINLDGGGGTKWMGTIGKLALPGGLFHHVTPTYMLIATDLSDLRVEASRIAKAAGTKFTQCMGSQEEFDQFYQEHFVAPLKKIILSYKLPRKREEGVRHTKGRGCWIYSGKRAMDSLAF